MSEATRNFFDDYTLDDVEESKIQVEASTAPSPEERNLSPQKQELLASIRAGIIGG
jgi:hypothetical protein